MSGEALKKLVAEIRGVHSFFQAGNIKPADALDALEEIDARLTELENRANGKPEPVPPKA